MNKRAITALTFAISATLLVLGSCGRKPAVSPEQPSPFPVGDFETVWVNPQIVFSDTLVTVIRAERIDSLPRDPSLPAAPALPVIGFVVSLPTCNVAVNLLNEDLQVVYPLFLQKLPAGFYKVTLNSGAIREPGLFPGTYFLRADFCGEVETTLFTVD